MELNNTQDRIFLLSKTEAEVYFNLDERNEQVETRVAPTPYAIARDAYISDMYQTAEGLSAGQWLLRTPSFDYFEGMVVFQDGKFERSNHKDKGSGNLTVARPAIWLDLDADIF